MHDESSETRPMTIPEAARRAGWSPSRMRRHLLAAHAQLAGGLLVNVGRGTRRPRWTVTLAALKMLHPNWYIDPEAQARTIEWLSERLDEEQGERVALSRRVTAQHDRLMAVARLVTPPTLLALVRAR